MSLPPDAAPPGHLPKAATPPWPIQPPPHGAAVGTIPVRPRPRRPEPAIGTLGIALIGGAAAAAIGLLIALPLLRAKPAPAKRRPSRGRKKKAA